jgi:hypothetical protein
MKLLYRNVECTPVQFLSAILATSAAGEVATLAVVSGLIELREAHLDFPDEYVWDIGPALSAKIEEITIGQCKVAL